MRGVSRRSLVPSSPEWIPGELTTDRREEPEIGIVFPSIWIEGTFDPSDELEAWNTRLLNPILSEICWSPENSTETPDLPSESVCTERFRYFKFMTGLMPPSFLVTRKMVLTYWPWVGDTSIVAPFRIISCTYLSTRAFISGLKVGWKGGAIWHGFDTHSIW